RRITGRDCVSRLCVGPLISGDELMGMAEKKILEVALAEAGLVKKNAADLLGITFRSFRYRMDRFGIE
ncbi:MAG: helix-turn-helix domain-containing protein, partial [Thermodesulfobacteriota bacterium]|nr:helix-turn-helix domain-containing protein [Thermodesulfobacteriota bacterium]